MSKPEPYETRILEDCPDCGGGLLGEVCHDCHCFWEFKDIREVNERGTDNV